MNPARAQFAAQSTKPLPTLEQLLAYIPTWLLDLVARVHEEEVVYGRSGDARLRLDRNLYGFSVQDAKTGDRMDPLTWKTPLWQTARNLRERT